MLVAARPRALVSAAFILARCAARAATTVALRPGEAASEDEKTILFVRHAEGWHNKHARELPNWHADALGLTEAYRDARLTPVGEGQARALNAELAANATFVPPDVVVVSTLTWTIQTAALAFEGFDVPFEATELCRERIADHECDHRRTRAALEADFGSFVDFSDVVDDDDALWTSRKEVEPDEMAATLCSERAADFLAWLAARPEPRVAVVSHWVFLKHLFALYPAFPELAENFRNAELRVAAISARRNDEL